MFYNSCVWVMAQGISLELSIPSKEKVYISVCHQSLLGWLVVNSSQVKSFGVLTFIRGFQNILGLLINKEKVRNEISYMPILGFFHFFLCLLKNILRLNK